MGGDLRRDAATTWILDLAFAVEVFPCSLVALEAGVFVEFVGLAGFEVFGDELDLSDLVGGSALGGAEEGEKAPVDLVEGLLDPVF